MNAEPTAYLYSHDETGRTTLRMPDERMFERRWSEIPLYTQADAINAQMLEALRRVRYVLNDYADVVDGSDVRQLPNSAMSAQTACGDEVEAAIRAAEGEKT